jgi:hypothetical protein
MGKRGDWVGASQVLGGVLAQAGLGHLLYEDKLRRQWTALLGPRASTMASLETLKGWTLKMRVESAVWRMELHYQRDSIRARANQILGAELIKEVILV